MTIQFYLAVMLVLGWCLGIFSYALVRFAAQYIDEAAARRKAKAMHPSNGAPLVGSFHTRRETDWLDRFMADAEADWAVEDQPLPEMPPLPDWLKLPEQRKATW